MPKLFIAFASAMLLLASSSIWTGVGKTKTSVPAHTNLHQEEAALR